MTASDMRVTCPACGVRGYTGDGFDILGHSGARLVLRCRNHEAGRIDYPQCKETFLARRRLLGASMKTWRLTPESQGAIVGHWFSSGGHRR